MHTLRKWFRTQLEGVMTSSYIERLLGHVSTEYLDGAYFKPPEADMVAAYRRAIPNLTILEDIQSEEFQKRQLLRQAALLLPQDKLKLLQEILARERSIDVAVDEFRKLRTESGPQVPPEERLRRLGDESNNCHKIVESEDEMLQLLDEGWELVRELNGDRFLMRVNT